MALKIMNPGTELSQQLYSELPTGCRLWWNYLQFSNHGGERLDRREQSRRW